DRPSGRIPPRRRRRQRGADSPWSPTARCSRAPRLRLLVPGTGLTDDGRQRGPDQRKHADRMGTRTGPARFGQPTPGGGPRSPLARRRVARSAGVDGARLAVSAFAIDELVAALGDADIVAVPAVHLHRRAGAGVLERVVAGAPRDVGGGERVADVRPVIARAADHGDAVDGADGADAVVPGTAVEDGVSARAGVDVVVARAATDQIVPPIPVDRVVAVAADDDVGASGSLDDGGTGLTGGVEPGVAGRSTLAQSSDGAGRSDLVDRHDCIDQE